MIIAETFKIKCPQILVEMFGLILFNIVWHVSCLLGAIRIYLQLGEPVPRIFFYVFEFFQIRMDGEERVRHKNST